MKRSGSRRFAHQLAVALGHINVNAMLRSITAKQFTEWEVYARMEPFNQRCDDYRTASIVQVIANVNRGRNQPAYKLEDFLLKWDQELDEFPRKQTWQQQKEIAYLIAAAFNAPGVNL